MITLRHETPSQSVVSTRRTRIGGRRVRFARSDGLRPGRVIDTTEASSPATGAETSFQSGTSSGRPSSSARSPVSVRADHSRMIGKNTLTAESAETAEKEFLCAPCGSS